MCDNSLPVNNFFYKDMLILKHDQRTRNTKITTSDCEHVSC